MKTKLYASKNFWRSFRATAGIAFALLACQVQAQTIVFDDFTYTSNSDPAIGTFNNWEIQNNIDGPIYPANFSKNNVTFGVDPADANNTVMTVASSTTNQTSSIINGRLQSKGYDYTEGTYAARVYFDDSPATNQDGTIQTFYSIVSSNLAADQNKYSEIDFEYLPYDVWGTRSNKNMYMTSYNSYTATTMVKAYKSSVKSYAGWHTLVYSYTDKVNVKFWIDGVFMGQVSKADDGSGRTVYPRSPVQVAFANWLFWESGTTPLGPGANRRTYNMKVDWFLYFKDAEKTTAEILSLVSNYKATGVRRRNLAGQVDQVVVVGTTRATVYKDCNYGGYAVNLTAGDYTLSQLQAKGILNDDISSLKVSSGYEVVLYTDDNFTGTSLVVNADNSCVVNNNFNDKTTSLKVRTVTTNPTFSVTTQAENYNNMAGIQTEPCTDNGAGLNVGYIDTGDWMVYNSINFPTSGSYQVEYRVASLNGGSQLSLDFNGGAIQLGAVNINSTGGWQNWTTVSHTVYVNAGTYNVGIYSQTGGWNLNWIRITKVGTARLAEDPGAIDPATVITDYALGLELYPNPASDQIYLTSSDDLNGAEVKVYNTECAEVMSTTISGSTVNISSLNPGIYTLMIYQQGQKLSRKFVKY